MKIYVLIILGLIGLDGGSKILAEKYLREEFFLISNWFSFHYVENTGIAFSLPLTGIFLKIITVILIFAIFWYYYKEEKKKQSLLLNLGYSLIFAGALGNAWERIYKGYVIDFISLEHFAIFNLADSYITLGAIGIMYYYYIQNKT